MNMFYRRSISEYQRQIGLKESFAAQTERLRDVLESAEQNDFDGLPADRRLRLLLLSPLVEIAWADGRVSRRESDAILEVADVYGLTDDNADYYELLDKLLARPIPQTVGRMWQDFHLLFEHLPELDRQEIAYCLTVQARFVAEQSSDNLIAFLRGERVSESERETLEIVAEQLENAQGRAQPLDKKRTAIPLSIAIEASDSMETFAPVSAADLSELEPEAAALEEYGKLVPLVPLVKTAWAEGRITKRERRLVFDAAARMDIKAGTAAHRRLEEWLELHPTQEFYDSALETLSEYWQQHGADEASRRKFDLLSDCTRIAEASGGSKNYPSGGAKICDEEIAVVKYIARKLNSPAAASAAAH